MYPPLHPCCWEGGLVSRTWEGDWEVSAGGSELDMAQGLARSRHRTQEAVKLRSQR